MTGMVSPFGQLLTEMRANTDLTAIVGARIDPNEAPASSLGKARVVFVDLGANLGQPGYRRLGQQLGTYAARCYGPSKDDHGDPINTGPITARQIAGVVAKQFHQKGTRMDVSRRVLLFTNVDSISGLLVDPDTREPYFIVTIGVTAGAEAAA